MRVTLFIFLIGWACLSNAQPVYFNNEYAHPQSAQAGWDVLVNPDSTYLVIGNNANLNTQGFLIMKLNKYGDLIWQKNYFKYFYNSVSIKKTFDGNLFVAGSAVIDTTTETVAPFLCKMDTMGDTLWIKYYQHNGYSYLEDMIFTSDSGTLMVGGTALTDTSLTHTASS